MDTNINLEQKIISFTPKDKVLRIVACKPIDNGVSEEDFLDIKFDMTNKHSLIGKVVYHNENENIATVEVDELSLSIELDLDLFDIKPQ